MLFKKCETCSEIGTFAFRRENPFRIFCDSHVTDHLMSPGNHSAEPALKKLTDSEVSSLKEAKTQSQRYFLDKAISNRNSDIRRYLRAIRRADEKCSSIIKAISSASVATDVEQILSHRALPLCSDSSLSHDLLKLNTASRFSTSRIFDLLKYKYSTLLSSFPSLFPSSPSNNTDDSSRQRWEISKQKKQHNCPIHTIAVSECERYLATGGRDKTIKVFELPNLRYLRTLNGHTHYVKSVVFLENKIVSGSSDKSIKFWEEDRCVRTLELHDGWVNSVCLSSCKRLIVSGGQDNKAIVYSLEDDRTLHTLEHPDVVWSVAFSQDSKQIVSGGGDFDQRGFLYVWRTETGELLRTLGSYSNAVTCVSYPGNFIVSSSDDKTMHIWETDIHSYRPLHSFSDHTDCVRSLDVRNNVIASFGLGEKILIRDLISGTVVQTPTAHGTYAIDRFGYAGIGLKILEGARTIISGGYDGKVTIWKRVN